MHIAMADPWLALEVLHELDEANAHYFALTLLSSSSRNYLVSLGCPSPRGRDPPNFVFPNVTSVRVLGK